jgi:hypothetical protein
MQINHIYNDTNSSISIGEKQLKHPESAHASTYIKQGDVEMNVMLSVQPGNVDPAWMCLAVHINGVPHTIYNGKPVDAPAFFKSLMEKLGKQD